MQKAIVDVLAKVTLSVHKKRLRKTKGVTKYKYGTVRIDNPQLTPFVGKHVRVKIAKV